MTTPDPLADRRLRLVRVPYHAVLDWFAFAATGYPDRVVLPFLADGLPRDVKVIAVHENHYARTFDFCVSHPSFDAVREGVEIPAHGGLVQWRADVVELRRDGGPTPSFWRDASPDDLPAIRVSLLPQARAILSHDADAPAVAEG